MRALLAGLLFQAVLQSGPIVKADEVEVTLTNGRTFDGEVDSLTDRATLWLRMESNKSVGRSGHDWKNIRQVRLSGKVLTGDEMKTRCMELRTTSSLVPLPPVVTTIQHEANTPKIVSISAFARISNFDSDIAIDGLKVTVIPTDGWQVVPVTGYLEVELLAEKGMPVRSRLQNKRFNRIGRWTRRIEVSEFSPDGISVNLPYQTQPGRDANILPDGLVRVRLKVSGMGAFDAADHWVRLQPFSRFLDRKFLGTGATSLRYPLNRPSLQLPRHIY